MPVSRTHILLRQTPGITRCGLCFSIVTIACPELSALGLRSLCNLKISREACNAQGKFLSGMHHFDPFRSEARALTILVDNGVTAVIVLKWKIELDLIRLQDTLAGKTDFAEEEPERIQEVFVPPKNQEIKRFFPSKTGPLFGLLRHWWFYKKRYYQCQNAKTGHDHTNRTYAVPNS